MVKLMRSALAVMLLGPAFALAQGKLRISTKALPDGNTGAAYAVQFEAKGGAPPYSWSVTSGSLPPGLILTTDGTLSGWPTQPGTYAFEITVRDSSGATASAGVRMRRSPGDLMRERPAKPTAARKRA